MNKSDRWSARGLLSAALGMSALLPGQSPAQDRAALMEQHRGGVMRLVAQAPAGTLDPQVNYSQMYWQIFPSMYDGLVAFKKAPGQAGFEVVPDLAEQLPTPTEAGTVYTFTLRKGVAFSNGKQVDVDDVLASFRRLFKVLSPVEETYFGVLVGSDECIKTPADCKLAGGVSVDPGTRTVTFHLKHPDPEFFYKLSVPNSAVLPADTAAKDAGTVPIPGTGAYMIDSFNPTNRMKIVRNPHFKQWSADSQPDGYPDEIDYDFGLTEQNEVNAVANGQADWMFDPVPTDRLGELGSKYASRVHLSPMTALWYAPMNTNLPPFDDVRVRQALNYAVNRDAAVKLFGGAKLAEPLCQILPPGFPGHLTDCLYTQNPGGKWSAPDMDKAKQLVAQSGTAGQKITVISDDSAISRSVGTYLASTLDELGYKADSKALSANIQFTYISNSKNNTQISISQWYPDYPAPSTFLYEMLACSSFRPGSDTSTNLAGFCDHKIDAAMEAASALAVTDQAGANEKWARADTDLMKAAPFVPLFAPRHVDFVSGRVGNFVFSNQFQWIAPQSWVK